MEKLTRDTVGVAVKAMAIPKERITRVITAIIPTRLDLGGWGDCWFGRIIAHLLSMTLDLFFVVVLVEVKERNGEGCVYYHAPDLASPDSDVGWYAQAAREFPGSKVNRKRPDAFFRYACRRLGVIVPKGRSLYVHVSYFGPPKSGLGTSASCGVGLLAVLAKYMGKDALTDLKKLASLAWMIGVIDMNGQAGIQDEAVAAMGLSHLIVHPGPWRKGRIIRPGCFPDFEHEPVILSPSWREWAESSMLLFYLGSVRADSNFRHDQVIRMAEEANEHVQRCLQGISDYALSAVEAVRLDKRKQFLEAMAGNSRLVYRMCGKGPNERVRLVARHLPKGAVYKEPGAWRDAMVAIACRNASQLDEFEHVARTELMPRLPGSRIYPVRFVQHGVRVYELETERLAA